MEGKMTTPGGTNAGRRLSDLAESFAQHATAPPAVADEPEPESRFGYHIGPLGLLVQPGVLAEVLAVPSIERLPGTPPWLLGITNFRGTVVPVFRLHDLLDDTKPDRPPGYCLALSQREGLVALVVDDRPRQVTAPKRLHDRPLLPGLLSECVKACYLEGDNLWLDIDYERLLWSLSERISGGAAAAA